MGSTVRRLRVTRPIQVVTLDSHVDLSDVRDVVRAYRLLMVEQVSRQCL